MPPEQVSPSLVVLGLVATGICAGSLFVWIMAILRLARGAPVVLYEPRRPLPRRGTDVLMVVILLLILSLIGRQIYAGFVSGPAEPRAPAAGEADGQGKSPVDPAHAKAPGGPTASELASAFIFELLIVATTIGCVVAVAGASGRDLGFTTSHLGYDFLLGGAAYLAGVVPISLIQFGLDRLGFSYSHPLIESYKESPNENMLIVSGIGAILVAPFCEEVMFRVLLQGWFESLEASRQMAKQLLVRSTAIVAEAVAEPQIVTAEPADAAAKPEAVAVSTGNPYQSPPPVAASAAVEPMLAATKPAWWPIALSSLLFAMTHWGQGLAPIPLFFFAAILGYVYQRTHRLWPSLVAHSLLNAGSMAILWLSTKLPS